MGIFGIAEIIDRLLRARAKITSAILAWPFGRWLRCSLLTDPLAGYARRSRHASGQKSCAIITEFSFAWSLGAATWGIGPAALGGAGRPAQRRRRKGPSENNIYILTWSFGGWR